MRSRTWLDRSAYTYGLHGTPTSFTLEERIATLEGGKHTMLVSSGLAAVTMVDIALLKSGDQVLLPHNVYAPNKTFTRTELAAWGIDHAVYDAMDAASLAAAITPATKLVWLEAAGLGDAGVPRPALADPRRARARAAGGDRARQHLGRRHRVRCLRARHRRDGPCPHQVPVRRRRRADGLGDLPRRRAVPHAGAVAQPRRPWRRHQRRGARAALAAVDGAALCRARRSRACLRGLVPVAQGIRARAAPGPAGFAGPRALGVALHARRRGW